MVEQKDNPSSWQEQERESSPSCSLSLPPSLRPRLQEPWVEGKEGASERFFWKAENLGAGEALGMPLFQETENGLKKGEPMSQHPLLSDPLLGPVFLMGLMWAKQVNRVDLSPHPAMPATRDMMKMGSHSSPSWALSSAVN